MPIYNKLVRDNIPEIIGETGKGFSVRYLGDVDFINALDAKLQEELNEYYFSGEDTEAIEELADMLEVIYAIADFYGYDEQDLDDIRMVKRIKRGTFKERVFLIDVED